MVKSKVLGTIDNETQEGVERKRIQNPSINGTVRGGPSSWNVLCG